MSNQNTKNLKRTHLGKNLSYSMQNMYSDCHVPSNPDEQHCFDGSDEHFPVSAECSDLKKVNENM